MTNQDKQREAVHDEGLTVAYLKGVQDGKDKARKEMEGLEEIILSKHIYTNGGTDSDDFVTVPINELAYAIREYLGVK